MRTNPDTPPARRLARLTLLAVLSAGLLPACTQQPTDLPAPKREVAEAFPGTSAAPLGDTSVPSAQAVLFPAAAQPSPPSTGARDTSGLTKAEESQSMPQGGQANDHSAPLPPAARASTP